MARSTADVAWFTDAVLKYLDIRFRVPYSQVVDLSDGIEWPRWCVGGRMNIVDNCVDKWAADPTTAATARRLSGRAKRGRRGR
jgi:acetyl-CoA synthetase